MRIAIERVITGERATRVRDSHRRAFSALGPLAAEPQMLDDELYYGLLAHPDVLEFIAWTEDEQPGAVVMSTPNLGLVPWIEPQFYAARYPEHTARDAVFYVPSLHVDPDHRGGPLLHAIIATYAQFIAGHRGVIAFDTCRWDIDNVAVPEFIERIGTLTVDAICEEVDSQHYYGYQVTALKDIDLRERLPEDITVDHSVPAADAPEVADVAAGDSERTRQP